MTPAVLAVDAGQTEIRAALADDGRGPGVGDRARMATVPGVLGIGERVGRQVDEPAPARMATVPGVLGIGERVGRQVDEPAPARIATAPGVLRMAQRVGPDEVGTALLGAIAGLGPLPEPMPPVGVGLSGFEAATAEDLRRVGELLRRELAIQRLAIASDGLTSLLGALGERDGAVVAAGTGTVCVARRGERLMKVDGWGALLGDAGSGFAIGRAGLDVALREADGRGGSAPLLRAAERRYGPLPGLSEEIYAAPVPTRAIAAFAADVAHEAGAGDRHALAILEQAATELALSARAALDRLFEADEPATVSYAGNVFRAGAPLLEPFERSLRERRPDTRLIAPAGDALAGAALIAGLDESRLRAQAGILWRAP